MKRPVWLIFCMALLPVSCAVVSDEKPFAPHYVELPRKPYFPAVTNIPAGNRLSEEGIALGRHLFYDIRIGGKHETDSMISCASCHVQAHGFDAGTGNSRFEDGRMRGVAGETAHVPLPLVNIAYNLYGLGWISAVAYPDGTLEKFIGNTLLDSVEFSTTKQDIVDRIAAIDLYPPMFKATFGSQEVTFDRICLALGQFVRSLVSTDSKFDRYLRGEEHLTDEEMKGYVLFTTEEGADCFHCHGGGGNVLFSTYENLINGLDALENFNDPHDRYSISGKDADRGAYRVPTLRNIAHTAPYMHDGRFTTLEEVIDQYSENVHHSPYISPLMHHVKERGVQLTEAEKVCLKAFLLTLSDESFLQDPKLSNPFINDTILP